MNSLLILPRHIACSTTLLGRGHYIRLRPVATSTLTSASHSKRSFGRLSFRTARHSKIVRSRHELREAFPRDKNGRGISAARESVVTAAVTAFMGLSMAFLGGIAYYAWYKKTVLDKIEQAFDKGSEPPPSLNRAYWFSTDPQSMDFLDLVDRYTAGENWNLRRREQDLIDRIIQGDETKRYFILLGAKAAGKMSMIVTAMLAKKGAGVALCNAHPDLEVFRQRLGQALNYEYHEDTQTGLFLRRDPREGSPGLEIERALDKLEEVAFRRSNRTGRPLVLVINNIHNIKNDDEGKAMLKQLQDRAETWAAFGILTMVFTSDDFWPFDFFRRQATRMSTMSIYDLGTDEATTLCQNIRQSIALPSVPRSTIEQAIDIVGGKLKHVSRIARSLDVPETARHMLEVETGWLQSQIGLIRDCDDEVAGEQTWSSCAWLLLREFVRLREKQERDVQARITAGELASDAMKHLPLPAISYYECREIMTRADFLEELDRMNIISIDTNYDVRPDSALILAAARSVVNSESFEGKLESVRNHLKEIKNSEHTRELIVRTLVEGDWPRCIVRDDCSLDRRV